MVTLSGPIGLDQLAMMNDYVDLLLTNRVTTIYFDFSGVPSLSVSAVGALSTIRDRVNEHGGRLLLAGLQGGLNPLVDLDHLRRFFTVFDGPLPVDQHAEAGEAQTEVDDDRPTGPPEISHELDGVIPDTSSAGEGESSSRIPAEAD